MKNAVALLKETYTRWSDHNAPRLGASVAFYSVLSFAPLLVLITAIIGLVFGHASAHGALVSEARQVIGDHGAETVDSLLKNAQKPASGIFASIIAFITLLFGASGVFTELQDALNIMWDATTKAASGVMGMIKQRIFSFGMVLSVGFLLLVSLLLSAGLAYIGHSFSQIVPLPPFVLEIINFVVSFAVVTALFALMFKYVPAIQIAWRDVLVGAVGTAILFTIGKFLLGIYLGKASVGSTYGAAGSLVAVVVWIYYSAQIFFFGAEFTRVYTDHTRGHSATKEPPAQKSTEETRPQIAHPVAAKPEVAHPVAAKTMAAAAGVGYYALPPASPASVPVPAPVERLPAIPAKVSAPARLSDPVPNRLSTTNHTRQPVTKPRLLTAVTVGFILGRVTSAIARDRSRD